AMRPGAASAGARVRPWLAAAFLLCATPGLARAQPASPAAAAAVKAPAVPPAAARPSDAPVPSCLDQSIVDELGQSLRPRGVQKRDFIKRGQLEIVGRGGLFAGDLLSSSYIAGGALAWFPTEELGVETRFDVTYHK